jgi:very-short-patch-repair endonuclease
MNAGDERPHERGLRLHAESTTYLRKQDDRVIWFWNERVNRETNAVFEATYPALTDS